MLNRVPSSPAESAFLLLLSHWTAPPVTPGILLPPHPPPPDPTGCPQDKLRGGDGPISSLGLDSQLLLPQSGGPLFDSQEEVQEGCFAGS